MHPELTATTVRSPSQAPDMLLRQFVQAYWLRPENAFWMALRSRTLSACPWEHPSLDLSCGDGVFMFLHCGGSFDPDFDVFSAVGSLDRVRDEHVDIFDRVTDDYRPTVRSLPTDTIEVGTDLKPTLLAKAGRLNFYGRLVEHDHEQPLPFDDASFRSVYCNAAYWVNGIDRFLREIARVTQPAGRVVLQVKLDCMRRYTLEKHRHALGDRFMDIIGRGRLACWPTLTDRATWERRFAQAGFTIDDATPFITETHARIWDIGLRPIAPLLIRMTDALTPETRSQIKRDWVDLFCELLAPLCDPDFTLSETPDEPAEIQYVLTPRGR